MKNKDNDILEIDDGTKNYLKNNLNIDVNPIYANRSTFENLRPNTADF